MRHNRHVVAVALVVLIAMLGCSKDFSSDTAFDASATVTPTPSESTAAPPIVSKQAQPEPPPLVEGQAACYDRSDLTEFGRITSRLGYALAPGRLPEGFENVRVGFSGGIAQISYDKAGRQQLIVAYPVDFGPEDNQLMRGIGLIRPRDAIDEAQVGGGTAYFMRGGWSDATVIAGLGIDPANAAWDYEKSLGLFFDCATPAGTTVRVAIQARPGPVTWISDEEMVGIAESFTPVE